MSRRLILVLLFAGCVPGGCSPEATERQVVADPIDRLPDFPPRLAPLRLAVTPIAGGGTKVAADLLGAYLAEVLGGPVVTVVATSYASLGDRVGRPFDDPRALDLAVFSPLAFVDARSRHDMVPLASASTHGSPTYLGLLVVRADRDDLTELDHLRGTTVAWVDPLSTSGYLFPRALLRHRGHDPTRLFGEDLVVGDHVSAMRAVVDGRAAVAAVSSTYVEHPEVHDVDVRALRVLAKTERIPMDCAVVRADLSRRRAEAVRAALLTLDRHPEHAEPLARAWGFAAFVPYVADRYARIEALRAVEASLETAP